MHLFPDLLSPRGREVNIKGLPRSIYDKEKKRARKVTVEYLRAAMRDGIVKRSSITGISGDYEYGNIALLYGIAEKKVLPILRDVFLL